MSHPYFYIHNTLDYPSDDGSQQFAISDGLTHGIPPGSLTVPTIPISHGLTATHGIPPGSLVYAGYTPGHGAPIPISHGLTIPHGYYSRYPSSDQSRSLVPRRRHPRSRSQSSVLTQDLDLMGMLLYFFIRYTFAEISVTFLTFALWKQIIYHQIYQKKKKV